jgi:hypothetical protein
MAQVAEVIERDLAMINGITDMALLQRAVYFLLDRGERIEFIGDGWEPNFAIDGQWVIVSQVILRAYARGMAEADDQVRPAVTRGTPAADVWPMPIVSTPTESL